MPKQPIQTGPVSFVPGGGLLISTRTTLSDTVADKVTNAKSIVDAVIAAYEAKDPDIGTKGIAVLLGLAVTTLERAADQIETEAAHG
jgi:hypothetical protein